MEMYGDDEIELELVKQEIDAQKKWKWYSCSCNGKAFIMPDTHDDLGHDLYDVHRPDFHCKPILPGDEVWAYPKIYVRNARLREDMRERFQYSSVPEDYLILPAVMDAPEIAEKPYPAMRLSEWIMSSVGNGMMSIEELKQMALREKYPEAEIQPVIEALMRKGKIYESSGILKAIEAA
jgi:hypothetical protein